MENREWTLLLTFLSNISTKYIHESDNKFIVLFSSLNIFTSVPHFPFSFTIKDVVFHAPNRAHFCYLSQDLLCHTTNINNKKTFLVLKLDITSSTEHACTFHLSLNNQKHCLQQCCTSSIWGYICYKTLHEFPNQSNMDFLKIEFYEQKPISFIEYNDKTIWIL